MNNDNESLKHTIKYQNVSETYLKYAVFKYILLNDCYYEAIVRWIQHKEYPAPHFEIEKGLFLLYHLVSGVSGDGIEKYLPQSTFHTFYKKFWMDDENYKRINKIVNDSLNNMFSNIRLRILSSRKYNPDLFKHVTLVLDGHDSRINYTDTDLDRSRLYSYKFKKNRLRTQFGADMNDMVLIISKSEFCSGSSDGTIDGGYTLFITQFIELANKKGYDFNNDNFVYSICKNVNENLTITEEHFNKTSGSFRTKVENQFSEIGNKFYRFNNNKSIVKIDNVKFYNLQFRVACLLKNITKFVELFNIPILPHHKLWHSSNFEFPTEKKLFDIVISNNKQNKDKFNRMIQLQNNLLSLTISDNSMAIDETESNHSENNESDNDVPNFNERTRKRRRNIKGKQCSTASYEIESIIEHKKGNNAYLFQVKWVG
ncbi:hypothetical protein INT45_009254 [Circinella minor]|uniref:Chromo domain-containing protein n=1 Tax=Circinella minor TaxID=1195481 RepID=A0A8H7RLE9_9FUNG|nr:hypothetical protein INT45_009254 [Circinella minor]